MAAPQSNTVTFVVNLDAASAEFAGFAQTGAIDLFGATPPVKLWTLQAERSAEDGAAELVLRGWPRRIPTIQGLGDTLVDEVEDILDDPSYSEVAIILLVRKPEALLVEDGGAIASIAAGIPVLRPLVKELSPNRTRSARVWTIGAVLAGPEEHLDKAASLVRRGQDYNVPLLDTIVFLCGARSGQTSPRQRDAQAMLRLLIDAARADPEMRKSLRPRPAGTGPRIMWLRSDQLPRTDRPSLVRRAMTQTIDAIIEGGKDPTQGGDDTLERAVAEFLSLANPRHEEERPATGAFDPQWDDLLPGTADLWPNAQPYLAGLARELRRRLVDHYDVRVTAIRAQQTELDNRLFLSLRDLQERQIPLPDGGLSGTSASKLERQIDFTETRRREWHQSADQTRQELRTMLRSARDAARPEGAVSVELARFEDWDRFADLTKEAEAAAKKLPSSRWAILWLALPFMLWIVLVVLHSADWFAGEPLVDRPFFQRFLDGLASLSGHSLLALGGTAIAVAVLIPAPWHFRSRYRRAVADVRSQGDKLGKAIDRALDRALSLASFSNAALLADILSRRLRSRSSQDRRNRFRAEFDRLRHTQAEAADAKVVEALRQLVSDAPLERLVLRMIGRWRALVAPDGSFTVRIWASDQAHGLPIDRDASRDSLLQLPSSWATTEIMVDATPLGPPVREAQAGREYAETGSGERL